ncbi:DUF5367 family protein [Phenylobacterium sp.]|uniref:DUF5367 family protein n=1 Tax=Phenylobacterium sp. TaxID=1871053 RepID=UPI0025F6E1CD|nr:DUF5367 family protein [Phenylobacterium sp.]
MAVTTKETTILALMGFGIWVSGVITFRFGGALLFESGLPILLASGVGIAISVCLLLRTTMSWRKAPAAQALAVATIMGLPGLFCDVVYILNFSALTGLKPTTAGPFAAVVIFGNAVLLTYGLVTAARAARA